MKLIIDFKTEVGDEYALREALEDGDLTWVSEITGGLRIIEAEEYFE